MGGSGGGGSLGDLSFLEKRAKEELKRASDETTRNVFISFDSDDLDDVNMLRGQAKSENTPFEFQDWSVKVPFDSTRAEYIKRKIRERIRQCSVTVVYITAKTAQSRWVDWEIRESIKLGKGVLGVYKGDSAPKTLPKAIKEHGIRPIKWSHDGLAAGIAAAAKNRDE